LICEDILQAGGVVIMSKGNAYFYAQIIKNEL